MNIQRNIALKKYNTLAVEAVADFFVAIDDEAELIAAIDYAKQNALAVCVIGGGSNIVFSKDVSGLVIQLLTKGISIVDQDDEFIVTVKAGENWHDFVCYCVEHGYHGLENLALIPGNVGAAAIQNIGAYGVELSDVLQSVKGLALNTLHWQILNKDQCQLSYRHSVFKSQLKDAFVITELSLRLSKVFKPNVQYQALTQYLNKNGIKKPTAAQLTDAVIAIRSSKLPMPQLLANAGSFFKNPVVSKRQCDDLLQHFPAMVYYPIDDQSVKLAAGWLIEKSGWKGKRVNAVSMHEQQALVLINHGGSGADILAYADQVRASVKKQFNVDLEVEPSIYS